jgi:hypothetical protein
LVKLDGNSSLIINNGALLEQLLLEKIIQLFQQLEGKEVEVIIKFFKIHYMMAIVYVVSVPKKKNLGSTNTRYPLRNHAFLGAWSYYASPLRLASTMVDCC